MPMLVLKVSGLGFKNNHGCVVYEEQESLVVWSGLVSNGYLLHAMHAAQCILVGSVRVYRSLDVKMAITLYLI